MSVELERRQGAEPPSAAEPAGEPTHPSERGAAGEPERIVSREDMAVSEEFRTYRAMSSVAMAAFGAGLLSVFSLMNTALGVIPFVGIVLGIRAIQSIRRRPDELTGTVFARVGLAFSLVFLLASWGLAAFQYATEVPDGYLRASYATLQPEPTNPDQPPASADELEGQQVFFKGYIYPFGLNTSEPLKSFLLVRDNGTCCFGGTASKPGDTIHVILADPLRLNYSPGLHNLGGTFRVNKAAQSADDVWYLLEADYAQ